DGITGINVTPLVDITLVLLIIFMVTAKMIVSQSVPLDLPKAASGVEVQVVFSVVLAADGTAQVDSKTIPNDDAILQLA
ncbi:ExbD/TolR family protein, partial [Salmonella enterica]|uniref:ExbD/TolR family protein n=1 Tax=Salmonella enterica TaxID=28901 RepID=UPI003D292979